MAPVSRGGLLGVAVLVAALLASTGCDRQPRFVPPAVDSTLVAGQDAFAEQVRQVQQRWAGSGDGAEAARLSAELLLADLRARTADGAWEARARELLDSLGIGAECAGAPGALAVNFFSRSDPSAGSWPWLFWDDRGSVQGGEVEGQGMSLVALATRGLAADTAVGAAPAIAALFSRRAGGGAQPFVVVWRAAGGLEQTQTLGPDSLGGVGTGAFEMGDDGVTRLATRTWRPTPRFDECAACPHVVHERRFRWEPEGFVGVEDQIVPSPYVTFVALVRALSAGDEEGARRCVTRPELLGAARMAGWATTRGPWRVAPGSAGREDEMVFYRGPREGWRVGFERTPDGWRVDAIAPAPRVIE